MAGHFASTRLGTWPEFEYFKDYLKDGQKVLDWGCGSGRYYRVIKNKKVQYFGVDLSSELVKIARTEFQKEIEKGSAHFICSENGELSFPKDFFDVAVMIASFHHLPSRATRLDLLKKVYQELKPGGILVITVWNLTSSWAKKKQKQPGWKSFGDNDYLVPWKDKSGKILAQRYYHSFTKEELKELLKISGFKIELLEFSEAHWRDDKGGRNLIAIAKK